MKLTSIIGVALVLFTAISCTGPTVEGDLCQRTFKPYPDLNPQRTVEKGNDQFVEGMVAYNAANYAEAASKLKEFVRRSNTDKSAYLYLSCSYLALNKPYDAEMELDHVEQGNLGQYTDETEWYTVVSWVCSDQLDRARVGAKEIAGKKHTYKLQAVQLLKALGE